MRRLVILLALVGICSGLLAPIASADPARGAVFSGTGVWIDIWDALENDLTPSFGPPQVRATGSVFL